jgi:hypothetical protein
MAISANYPQPVYVNGFACMNCAQVAEAKQDIDPAHPQSGPGGVDAQFDPTAKQTPAVIFGGALAGIGAASGGQPPSTQAVGGLVDLSV